MYFEDLEKDALEIYVREAYEDSNHDFEAMEEALLFENTPIDVLVSIGDALPLHNPTKLAPLLVRHPNYTIELHDRIIEKLKNLWWDDDPTECRLAWESLDLARQEYIGETVDRLARDSEELSQISETADESHSILEEEPRSASESAANRLLNKES